MILCIKENRKLVSTCHQCQLWSTKYVEIPSTIRQLQKSLQIIDGTEFQKAVAILLRRYGIPQIHITPYNKHSSGLVEQGHFTIRQAILKDCGKHPEQWPSKVPLAFFADCVTTRRSDRKSTRLNSSHSGESRMPSSA